MEDIRLPGTQRSPMYLSMLIIGFRRDIRILRGYCLHCEAVTHLENVSRLRVVCICPRGSDYEKLACF